MFEIKQVVEVKAHGGMVVIRAIDQYNPPAREDGYLRYCLDKVADQSVPLVDAAVADYTQHRYFIDTQGYLVITKKEEVIHA